MDAERPAQAAPDTAVERRADRLTWWERRAEWPLAGVALIFLAAYSIQVLADPSAQVDRLLDVVVGLAWLAFAIEYLVRLSIAPERGKWFFRHLLDLAIVVLPVIRPLRLLRLVILVGALQKAIGGAIRGKVVMYTICTVALLIYVASLAIYETESPLPEASITTFGDALWWSMTTVTTVGYGDYAPVTTTGRIIAALLMLGGISLIGVVTATIASWIVQRVSEDDDAQAAATARHIEDLRSEIRELRLLVASRADPAHLDGPPRDR